MNLKERRAAVVNNIWNAVEIIDAKTRMDCIKRAVELLLPEPEPIEALRAGCVKLTVEEPEKDFGHELLERWNVELVAFFSSLGISTPQEGFIKAPQCLGQCMDEVRKVYSNRPVVRKTATSPNADICPIKPEPARHFEAMEVRGRFHLCRVCGNPRSEHLSEPLKVDQ
jgi:hypothetical protein